MGTKITLFEAHFGGGQSEPRSAANDGSDNRTAGSKASIPGGPTQSSERALGRTVLDVGALAGSILFGVMLLRRARRNGAEPIVIEERSRE